LPRFAFPKRMLVILVFVINDLAMVFFVLPRLFPVKSRVVIVVVTLDIWAKKSF
jgi:hypothetical protein